MQDIIDSLYNTFEKYSTSKKEKNYNPITILTQFCDFKYFS